jgi:hypothetical protein
VDSLTSNFYEVSPYEGFDPSPHPDDMQGYGSNHQIFEEVIRATKPALIVEVGSWKGASAIHMAKIVKALGLDTKIICVDTWLGSPEHFLGSKEARDSLRITHGFPNLYYTFLGNVVRQGMQDIIIPLATTSASGAIILQKRNIRPDLIYIDAAHDYEGALSDIRDYWTILADTGILFGDDYITWAGVTQAVNEFALKEKAQLYGQPGKFVMYKGSAVRAKIAITG